MELVNKSRHLALSDFYSILQQEFISYYVRSRIYPGEYALKYERYCQCKRIKIDKIEQRNGLPSIFNSDVVKERYLDKFFTPYGLPNFEYKDLYSKSVMGRWDMIYWFSSGTSIKVKTGNDTVTTTILENLYNIQTVIVVINGEHLQFDYSFITRLISDDLINW